MIVGFDNGEEYRQVAPEVLPRPTSLEVPCPCCGTAVEYAAVEDDAGALCCVEDWPVCHGCKILIDVPPVRILQAESTFFVSDFPS